MAEFGAHLTSSLGEQPSIFEVLACDGLAKGLKAAFKHFTKVLLDNNPERYTNLNHYSEELYTLIDLVVQTYHLKKYNASFSENFYSLKRTTCKQNPIELGKDSFYKSLGFLVLLPYLSKKLEDKYDKLREEVEATNDAKKARIQLYSLLLFTTKMMATTYQFLYAVGRSKYHSPLLQLAGCQLRTLTQSDLAHFESKSNQTKTDWAVINLCIQSFGKFASLLTTGISVGAFFLQFLEWWFNQEGVPKNLGSLPIPDAPVKIESLKSGVCPICDKKIQNITLLTTSGICFCYRCIHQSLNSNLCCPVTKYPSSHSELVKLYPPSD